ncbi:bifunctional tRNA (5-methylaminomethyl-2-thiouridine)(34)-methyltransferase MnmD/FAD-dependent 5-carboxymethylaminomethyl-2-thiouridine(34) oxidoreductase MnmC [Halomonas binhaiensis]|uniref:bifunctional tRNA (5-methylaminomethyl-2-thiouridine)(34)-methyltransferase MnmD/FAD-dependent 5-carboxymethylaminomethyl-2-thiouridine(34) oxidoreductase MnmC n=1 Tax=Halomonas binhaiensis TaxID=2562282 RepID=UPI001F071775|nr:bifunctional tRNA (5-methylaminomethyl-2-thiouridine)(34)-methyltransferase MnmD/FAD-dependent 5-carboxymethylaminomethyl-2-thiouridine(34) oxidoreductase MnmC [Halomonas binhaiensis]
MSIAPDGLPALCAAELAHLDWRSDDTGESSPHSQAFDDVYFSRHDGRAETEHVFIAGNHLPERFAAWQASRPFVIAETGFGTGLNMLCAWAAFERHAQAESRLHLVSTECYPMGRDDLERALAAWPDLADKARVIIAQWPAPVSGVHRLILSSRVILDLHIGDSTERLALLDGQVDAWFLDGFAPSKNPEMWRPELFEQMAARSRPNATFATFTCAGIVKRGLKAAGFAWRKVPGFGRKREMLAGEISTPAQDARRNSTPWFHPPAPHSTQHIAVIGAGIAGCTAAEALARRGIAVTLIDAHGPGAEASGNEQGALYVKLAVDTNHQSRTYLSGLLYSYRWLSRLDPAHRLWQPSGVLQLATSEQETRRQIRFLEHHPLPADVVHAVDAEQASRLAGVSIDHGGLFYTLAGWVRPRLLCEKLASGPGIRQIRAKVTQLEHRDEGWLLTLDGEQQALTVDQVVVATAADSTRFAQLEGLPLQPVRGQVSRMPVAEMATPATVICAGGYLAPPLNGWLTFGATFTPNSSDRTVTAEDHRANLDELERTLPGYLKHLADNGLAITPDALEGRAAVRAASPDKSPYAGPVPMRDAWLEDYARLGKDATRIPNTAGQYYPGMWISAAHGSRGLASAPLCAELLASRICDEPLPLELPLADHLHPGRRIIRDLIRGKRGSGGRRAVSCKP